MFGQRDPLDLLLLSAMASAQNRQAKLKKQPTLVLAREAVIHETLKERYLNPANWRPGKILAVIHRAEDGATTLLGAFQHQTHVRHRETLKGTQHIPTGATKLVRLEGPHPVEDQMIVTGEHWLHDIQMKPAEFPENPEGLADHELTLDIHLSDLQVEAKGVKVQVRTERGWTRRVTLRDTTQFHCPTNRLAIFLPKGIDVLDGMSFENKKALKERLSRA